MSVCMCMCARIMLPKPELENPSFLFLVLTCKKSWINIMEEHLPKSSASSKDKGTSLEDVALMFTQNSWPIGAICVNFSRTKFLKPVSVKASWSNAVTACSGTARRTSIQPRLLARILMFSSDTLGKWIASRAIRRSSTSSSSYKSWL